MKYLYTICIACLSIAISAQSLTTKLNHYGEDEVILGEPVEVKLDQSLHSMHMAEDGRGLMISSFEAPNNGHQTSLVISGTDVDSKMQWSKAYADVGLYNYRPYLQTAIHQNHEGGLTGLFAGRTWYSSIINRFDQDGHHIWSREVVRADGNFEIGVGAVETASGKIFYFGGNAHEANFNLAIVDAESSEVETELRLNTVFEFLLTDVEATGSDAVLILGNLVRSSTQQSDIMLMKMDDKGDILWAKRIKDNPNLRANSMVETDEAYIVWAQSPDAWYCFWLDKTDGSMIASRAFLVDLNANLHEPPTIVGQDESSMIVSGLVYDDFLGSNVHITAVIDHKNYEMTMLTKQNQEGFGNFNITKYARLDDEMLYTMTGTTTIYEHHTMMTDGQLVACQDAESYQKINFRTIVGSIESLNFGPPTSDISGTYLLQQSSLQEPDHLSFDTELICEKEKEVVEEPEPEVEEDQITAFTFFPNPVQDLLTVNIAGLEEEQVELRIIDLLGRPIRTVMTTGNTVVNLSVNELSSGSYFLYVDRDGFVKSFPFEKI